MLDNTESTVCMYIFMLLTVNIMIVGLIFVIYHKFFRKGLLLNKTRTLKALKKKTYYIKKAPKEKVTTKKTPLKNKEEDPLCSLLRLLSIEKVKISFLNKSQIEHSVCLI